jgi:Gly-Xaa carboxypeptidase
MAWETTSLTLMRSSDRQLCALFRKMAAPAVRPDQQPPVKGEHWPRDDLPVSTDKIDCERLGGALDQVEEFQFKSLQKTRTRYRWLRLVALFSLVFLVQLFWAYVFSGQPRGSESDKLVGLDDLCPQVEALTTPGHGTLLESLDEEFGSTEFKLKAYESLGGAVRIP